MNSSGESSTPRRKLTAERRVVTILFSDVKGSTAMTENLDPEDWAEIMNEAFDYLTQPVIRYGGTVARLMGDAILPFFWRTNSSTCRAYCAPNNCSDLRLG